VPRPVTGQDHRHPEVRNESKSHDRRDQKYHTQPNDEVRSTGFHIKNLSCFNIDRLSTDARVDSSAAKLSGREAPKAAADPMPLNAMLIPVYLLRLRRCNSRTDPTMK
jgi:hypothetical protein